MIKLINSTFHNEAQTKEELVKFITGAQQLSFGQQCQEFERRFSAYQGREDSIFVNSGSSANFAILQALLNLGRLKQGDEVGFSAVTWSTNVSPMLILGLKPVPIDVELDTLNASAATFEAALARHPQMKAFMITNLLGLCDNIDVIAETAKKRNILLIEDNCESLGTVYKGKKLGNFSLASTFSFFVGHHMSTIEGGMVCTDDKELARMLRLVRAHGWDRNLAPADQEVIRKEHGITSAFFAKYTFYELGCNFRPTEINGFLGNTQLQYIDHIAKTRYENFLKLAKVIYARSDLYYPIRYNHLDLLSSFAIPVVCKKKETLDQLVKRCEQVVETRPIVAGDVTQQPFFKKYAAGSANELGNSNAYIVHDNGMYFANNPDLTEGDIKTLIELFS